MSTSDSRDYDISFKPLGVDAAIRAAAAAVSECTEVEDRPGHWSFTCPSDPYFPKGETLTVSGQNREAMEASRAKHFGTLALTLMGMSRRHAFVMLSCRTMRPGQIVEQVKGVAEDCLHPSLLTNKDLELDPA